MNESETKISSMYDISCPSGHRTTVRKSIYDRQLDTALFKRLHATNFSLIPKRPVKILGPGSYNPATIEEIYRRKQCSKFGPYYQRAKRFPVPFRKSKNSCSVQTITYGLGNIPDVLRTKREFETRHNAVRLNRQSSDSCRKRRELVPRAPPVTLYEKSSFVDELRRKQTGIHGPYAKFARDRGDSIPDWFKGPARVQDKAPPSIVDCLFSSAHRHKGKFLPIPSKLNSTVVPGFLTQSVMFSPGPTAYFNDQHSGKILCHQNRLPPSSKTLSVPSHLTSSEGVEQEKRQNVPPLGFLSSTERFHKLKNPLSHLGPASYLPDVCRPSCSNKRYLINRHSLVKKRNSHP